MSNSREGQIVSSAAVVYDQFFVPALFGQWAEPVLDAADVESGDRVLDVGCGTGVLARTAVRRVGDAGHVAGVDPNEGMLAVARAASERVEWVSGTAEALPFEDGAFDRAVSQFALMFFADRPKGIAEMARVVRPGGALGVAIWSSIEAAPGYAELAALIERQLGREAAEGVTAPFAMADPVLLGDLLGNSLDKVIIEPQRGTARFESIDDWLHTEIRGWTLADVIDDEQFERLLREARTELARFVGPDGRVGFPVQALIGTGTVPDGV